VSHTEPDVILFDLGGVLMDFGGLRRLAELSGEEEGPALRTRWIASRWVQAFERGGCDAQTFAEGIVDDWRLDLAPAEFLVDFARWSGGPFSGSLELVRNLHGTIQMGCVSNTNPVHWQRHLDHWGIVQHFDWTFTSHELGMMKPDPAVFRHVIQTIGTTSDRLLFLDDSDEHVQAARSAGMRAEHTRGLHEVQAALRSHLSADSAAGRALRSGSTRPPGN
jgi:HAD superfamily hydrolase (TIGR01509 family)